MDHGQGGKLEEEYTEPIDFGEPQEKPSKNIIIITSGIIIILLIILSIFMIQFFLLDKAPEITNMGGEEDQPGYFKNCCLTYFESNFTDFSNCPDINLQLASNIIKGDSRLFEIKTRGILTPEELLQDPKKRLDEEKEKEIFRKISDYYILAFENKYKGGNNEINTMINEIIKECLENNINEEICNDFEIVANLEQNEKFFPGMIYAKNYFEQKNLCENTWYDQILCTAMAKRDAKYCLESPDFTGHG